jgi:hypothetical protein
VDRGRLGQAVLAGLVEQSELEAVVAYVDGDQRVEGF